jgi:transcription elongation factor Elf1
MGTPYALAVLTCPRCGTENPEAARFCNACASRLQPDEPSLGEERKNVTVVFVDLVGEKRSGIRTGTEPPGTRGSFFVQRRKRLRGAA